MKFVVFRLTRLWIGVTITKDAIARADPQAGGMIMANNQKPVELKTVRRNDVVRCEKCGEDYAVTYKRCPFCDEKQRSGGVIGRRVSNTRGGGYGGNRVNPLQVVVLVLSLILIIAALYIVFHAVAPLFNRGSKTPSGSESASSASGSQAPAPASSAPGTGDVSQPSVEPAGSEQPPVIQVDSLSLNYSDITLQADQSVRITARVSPENAEVAWSSSNESAAVVGADGTVTNVNTGASLVNVTITATAGDKTAECIVRMRGGSSGTAAPSSTSDPTTPGATSGGMTPGSASSAAGGKRGVVSNAGSGLRVRSGPGSDNSVIASLTNGSAVNILEDSGTGWYKVTFVGANGQNIEGYVSKDYITVQ